MKMRFSNWLGSLSRSSRAQSRNAAVGEILRTGSPALKGVNTTAH
jgi:hypothetical protein